MTNRLRTEIREDEEAEENLIVEEKPVREIPDNFFTQLFTKGILSTERATSALPFVLYLALLGMIYIANMHLAEKTIRDIDDLNKEVKERGWDYKTAKADMAFKSTLTEVAKRADTLGVRQSVEPPQKITVEEEVRDGN
ncbi:FtsL-like putative cell division protein [Mucilaginibacter sabulilitoris]|uniref:FtsL-like putative cell division protein n=1 Tax=Mucilaginibacter sabulilitoris TaxID=1173583 RepID=A0ABZ0TQM7_9SPHI|nr:FtsL-like putative cell division protein [Mucilaginibacter sabulilitoris]WPU95444.1 FtsL-like putative cell division protein [Mucilaginibacter sabulilitoris]